MNLRSPIRMVVLLIVLGINPQPIFSSPISTATLPVDTPKVRLIISRRLLTYQNRIEAEAGKISALFSCWFGPPPDSAPVLIVTDQPAGSGAEGYVITLTPPVIPFLRLLERQLAQEIARYWFTGGRHSNPLLSYGLPAYAAARYLETVYGKTNLIPDPGSSTLLAGISEHYLHRVYYYIAATNNLTFSVTEPQPDTGPFLTDAVLRAQSALLIRSLAKMFGTGLVDSCIRQFRQHCLFTDSGNAGMPAFLACLTAVAGPKQEVLINALANQDGKNDLKIQRLRRQGQNLLVDLSARDPLILPIRVKTDFSDHTSRIDTIILDPAATLVIPAAQAVRRITLDPDSFVLEADRWNNIYPRQLQTRFLFAPPDFESYQLFYGPWFWYDNYRGFQPGVWFQGRKFVDAGPVRGAHNWTLIHNYASKKSDWHTGISYQTPVIFYPVRLRLYLAGDNSFRDRGLKLYLNSEFGRPFRLPRNEIQFGYRLYELLDTTGRDPRAWNRARTAEIRCRFTRTHKIRIITAQHELTGAQGLKPLLSQYSYTRLSLVENITFTPADLLPVSVRIFAGYIAGSVPRQERFYLSGGLSYTPAEPISWAYEGFASGQERWHYDGDVNCRGYYGLYRSGRLGWGINIHLLPRPEWPFPLSALQPFLDLGNVADTFTPELLRPLLDAGIRIKLGPLYADLPFWKSAPEPGERHLAFRWTLGFKLTELLPGI